MFGFGFPVPPTEDNPAQVELWKERQPVPGAKIEGDPAQFVVLLRITVAVFMRQPILRRG